MTPVVERKTIVKLSVMLETYVTCHKLWYIALSNNCLACFLLTQVSIAKRAAMRDDANATRLVGKRL
jgi:hypothetical protein